MTAPPDAIALFRTVLANPADETPRLVFADWLEDSGRPHDAAWATFLRINSLEQGRFVRAEELDRITASVRAVLRIPASLFVRHRSVLLKLLPPKNIKVRLANFTPSSRVAECLTESMARHNRLVPLAVTSDELFLVSSGPMPGDWIALVEEMWRRQVVLVRGLYQEIAACHVRMYCADAERDTLLAALLVDFSETGNKQE